MKLYCYDPSIKSKPPELKEEHGPKSLRGKSISRINALKHGLAIDIATLPEFRDQVVTLAEMLSSGCDKDHQSHAFEAAAAALDIIRTRRYRQCFLLFRHQRSLADGRHTS